MKLTPRDYILAILPLVIGFGTSFFCRVGKDAGSVVKFRPPAAAFGIIWTILFIMFGISWAIAARNCSMHPAVCITIYSLAMASLALWIIVYGCGKSKLGACWVLVFSIACVIGCLSIGTPISKLLVAPLAAWAIFALMMNTTEVQLG